MIELPARSKFKYQKHVQFFRRRSRRTAARSPKDPKGAKMAAPVTDAGEFESWLNDRLDSLEVDREVYGAYILGVLQEEENDEEKEDALQGILSAFLVSTRGGVSRLSPASLQVLLSVRKHSCCQLMAYKERNVGVRDASASSGKVQTPQTVMGADLSKPDTKPDSKTWTF